MLVLGAESVHVTTLLLCAAVHMVYWVGPMLTSLNGWASPDLQGSPSAEPAALLSSGAAWGPGHQVAQLQEARRPALGKGVSAALKTERSSCQTWHEALGWRATAPKSAPGDPSLLSCSQEELIPYLESHASGSWEATLPEWTRCSNEEEFLVWPPLASSLLQPCNHTPRQGIPLKLQSLL